MNTFFRTFFIVSAMNVIGLQAYTPITWIDGVPNNLYAPLCASDVHSGKKNCSKRQAHMRTNLFTVAQLDGYNQYKAYGIAAQAHMHLDSVLNGLYGQIFTPVLLVHDRFTPRYYSLKDYQEHNRVVAAIGDVHFLLGYDAVRRKSFKLSGYLFGIVPTAQHALFHHGAQNRSISSDNHASWGIGSDCFVRVCGSPRHHLDWLTQADIIFHEGRKGIARLTQYNPFEWKKVSIHLNSNQTYRVTSGLAYKFKHFVSDFGVQFLYQPVGKWSFFDPTLSDVKKYYDPYFERWDAFIDLGWTGKLFKRPVYATIGLQHAAAGVNTYSTTNVVLKCGFDF